MTAVRLRAVAMYAFAAALLCFMLAPLLLVFPMSLTSSNTLQFPVPGYSLRWYEDLLADGRWIDALKVSVIIGIAATACALALGIPAAIALAWGRFPGKRFVAAVIAAPIVTPLVIVGVAAYFYFSRLGLVGDRLSIILVHAALALPVVVSMVERAAAWFRRYGVWSLLLSWLPIIGDPLTAVAGALRVDFLRFLIFVSLGKAARYGFILAAFKLWNG